VLLFIVMYGSLPEVTAVNIQQTFEYRVGTANYGLVSEVVYMLC